MEVVTVLLGGAMVFKFRFIGIFYLFSLPVVASDIDDKIVFWDLGQNPARYRTLYKGEMSEWKTGVADPGKICATVYLKGDESRIVYRNEDTQFYDSHQAYIRTINEYNLRNLPELVAVRDGARPHLLLPVFDPRTGLIKNGELGPEHKSATYSFLSDGTWRMLDFGADFGIYHVYPPLAEVVDDLKLKLNDISKGRRACNQRAERIARGVSKPQ